MNVPGVGWAGAMVVLGGGLLWGQTPETSKPLPEFPALLHQVEAHQREAEAIEKNYLYRESSRVEETDGNGKVKKVSTREFDVFWVEGVNVRRLVKKDGQDVSAEELKKEAEKTDKEVAKARERRAKADADRRETDSRGRDELTVSRMLELGAFTNERREQVNGRDTIAADFTGDPKAKTHTQLESAVHELSGTVWIDEADRSLVRVDGRFAHPYKIGGGLVVNVQEGTSFTFKMAKVNDEVWLRASLDASGHARIAVFAGVNGRVQARFGGYRRFKATSTILPGVQVEGPEDVPTGKEPLK